MIKAKINEREEQSHMQGSRRSGFSSCPAYSIESTVIGMRDGGAHEERATETELALALSVPESSFFIRERAIGVDAFESPRTFAHNSREASLRMSLHL